MSPRTLFGRAHKPEQAAGDDPEPKPVKGRNAGEPASFAWTEPIAASEPERKPASDDAKARVVLVGRGPSLAERLALATPHPTTIAAGAAIVLVAVTGLALISPSGEQATASRSNSPYGDASAQTPNANAGLTKEEFAALEGDGKSIKGDSRDPFVGDGYDSVMAQADARAKVAKASKDKQRKAKQAAEQRAKRAAARAPKFLGDFVYYSDYTPWERLKGAPSQWLNFDGQQTLMVETVGANAAELYVVSDVEVIDNKGRGYTYSYPLRRLRVAPGAVVRFADYRDVQGDDVTYTLRFRGAMKNPKHKP